MLGAHLGVEPIDIALGVAPIEADRGPTRQIRTEGRRGQAVPLRMPSHVEHGVARRRLMAGLLQEGEKLLARHVELAEGEGLDLDSVLRALGVEAPALALRASHSETAGRYADHHRTLGAFLKFALFLVGGETPTGRSARKDEKSEGLTKPAGFAAFHFAAPRSEERRVGKECRSRWT